MLSMISPERRRRLAIGLLFMYGSVDSFLDFAGTQAAAGYWLIVYVWMR
jgi:hypothetical protein